MKPAEETDYRDEGFLNGTYEHLDGIYDGTLTHTIEELRRERQDSRPIRVLFIGVGRGNEAIGAQRRFGEGVEVYAINKKEGEFYDAEALGAQVPSIDSQLRQQEMHLFESVRSRLKIVDVEDEATSFEKLFGGDKFDLVVFGNKSAIYMRDKIKVFNRLLQQWVKPEGFLFVQTVFILHQEEEIGEFFRQLTLKNPNVQRAGDSGLRLRNTGSLQIPLELEGEPGRVGLLPPYAFFSSYRTSQNDAELSARLSHAGLEQTAEAARFLKEIFTLPDGAVDPLLADLVKDSDSDEAWAQAFLTLLRNPPHPTAPLPSRLLSVHPYRSGPFARRDLIDEKAAQYLQDDWIGSLKKVLQGAAQQLNEQTTPSRSQQITIETLGFDTLRKLLAALFYATDGQGRLLMETDQELNFYRWIYREIPRLIVPRVADPWIDRGVLREALQNSFKLSNDEGNDAVRAAIDDLLRHPESGFIDAPSRLRFVTHSKRFDRIKQWILLALAANLVDYSHTSILDQIQEEGRDLGSYIVRRMNVPFLEELGGDQYIRRFIHRVMRPNTVLAHLPDNNAELAASLKLAEVLLSANRTLQIKMILKGDNGVMNDASVEDAHRLLKPPLGIPDIYAQLRTYLQNGRLTLLPGPSQHGMPLNLLPQNVIQALLEADVVFAEGEANSFALNGLSKEELYLGLRLKWPDGIAGVFGLERTPQIAADRPPAFVRIDGTQGPYYGNIYNRPDAGAHRTILQTLQAQAAGLEGIRRMDAEEFFLRHREQSGWMPHGATDFYATSVDNPTVTLFRPETLAAGLEKHVAAQQLELPGIQIAQKPIPPTLDQVRRPSVFILDDLILLTLPYTPTPAIRHRLGEPFPPLVQMIAKALLKELDAARVKILTIQAFEQNGRWYLAIAAAA